MDGPDRCAADPASGGARRDGGGIRELLAGETVTISGTHVELTGVALEQAPAVAPAVLLGTTGPKRLACAGRHADGILLPEGCGPAFVKWALQQTLATRTPRCVLYSWFSIDDDPAQAQRRLMPAIDHWLTWDLYPHPRRVAGVADPRRRAIQRDRRSRRRSPSVVTARCAPRRCNGWLRQVPTQSCSSRRGNRSNRCRFRLSLLDAACGRYVNAGGLRLLRSA